MTAPFAGEIAFIVGAASGIGVAVAQGFAAAGADVVIADVGGLSATARSVIEAGRAVEAIALDVTDDPSVKKALDQAARSFGRVDHVVICAGIATRHTIAQMPAEDWRRVIDVNLTGSFLMIKAAEQHLAAVGGGSITLISSVAARHVAYFSGAHYAASKTAQLGLVRHAAFELGRRGIRVNAIGPGPMTNRMGGGRHSKEKLKAFERDLPLQRAVEPEDIAAACLFLASPSARAITGVYLPVDGGFLTSRGQDYHRYFEIHEEQFY